MALELETSRWNDVIVVVCRGRIVFGDETTALAKTVRDLFVESTQIVLDMGAVRDMDSGGLGTVIGLVISARRAGGDIKLCNLSRKVQDVLNITKLVNVVEVYPGGPEAAAAFRRRTATA